MFFLSFIQFVCLSYDLLRRVLAAIIDDEDFQLLHSLFIDDEGVQTTTEIFLHVVCWDDYC